MKDLRDGAFTLEEGVLELPWQAWAEAHGLPTFRVSTSVDRALREADPAALRAWLRLWVLSQADDLLTIPPALSPEQHCVGLLDFTAPRSTGRLYLATHPDPEAAAQSARYLQLLRDEFAAMVEGTGHFPYRTRVELGARVRALEIWTTPGEEALLTEEVVGARMRATVDALTARRRDRHPPDPHALVVNAYADVRGNVIVVPVVVQRPPFLGASRADAWNWGSFGVFVGHELVHGYVSALEEGVIGIDGDFDALSDRSKCIGQRHVRTAEVEGEDQHYAGDVGEFASDLGGAQIAWRAWNMETARQMRDPRAVSVAPMTDEQLFLVGFAQAQCENEPPTWTDPHDNGERRVNLTVMDMPEFARAFECPADAPLAPVERCESPW